MGSTPAGSSAMSVIIKRLQRAHIWEQKLLNALGNARLRPSTSPRSNVVEQSHKTEVHMQLLMTVKQSHTRIVGHEVHFCFLVAP
jgi:hypothetical protein